MGRSFFIALHCRLQFIVLVQAVPLPPPLGEVAEHCEAGEGFVPSLSKIKDFCQLSHRESQGRDKPQFRNLDSYFQCCYNVSIVSGS